MDIIIFLILYLSGCIVGFKVIQNKNKKRDKKIEDTMIVQWCSLSWIVVVLLWMDKYNE